MIESPAFALVWTKGTRDRSSLSEAERWQFDLQLLSYFHVFDTMHYEARMGAGEKGLLAAEEKSLAALFAWPGVREWWAENPYAFGPEFREFVERFRKEL